MAQITGFFHGGITVSDMDRSLRFYHEGLGLEILFDRLLDGPYLPVVLGLEFTAIRAAYLIIPGGGYVELLEYQGIERLPARSRPCDFGGGHLCLYVDDVEAMHAHLVAMGYHARSKQVVDACKKHKGFYLGSIGGPAAILAKNCIKKVEVLEYPELGMEAIWRIQVENFPAFIVTDDKGNDFFGELKL